MEDFSGERTPFQKNREESENEASVSFFGALARRCSSFFRFGPRARFPSSLKPRGTTVEELS
jgi:hypothetical protein